MNGGAGKERDQRRALMWICLLVGLCYVLQQKRQSIIMDNIAAGRYQVCQNSYSYSTTHILFQSKFQPTPQTKKKKKKFITYDN